MSDLSQLYQEMILDHNRRPRNFFPLPDADRKAEGYNPLCGDRLTVFLKVDRKDGERIGEISFQGNGCAISKASASLMTDAIKGKTKEEAMALFEQFRGMVTARTAKDREGTAVLPGIGKLAVFSGVSEYPSRVKCATLAWHTLKAALEGGEGAVTTERDEKVVDGAKEGSKGPDDLKDRVVEALSECYDPEIPVNIYELGLIYDVKIDDGVVAIRMTLTSPMCPVAGSLPPEVERRVREVPGVSEVSVEVVWDPPWSPERMSEAARLQLGIM